uniref:Uncharacterized protein n=1 Tax=Siphoviridae sp. ctqzz19 TaxID=2825682 RepID=A0A8S5U299_9CAUD|nr:MAG TPA: hypothetical protein [Siphoviridae sp. ctqzz19]
MVLVFPSTCDYIIHLWGHKVNSFYCVLYTCTKIFL